MRFDALAMALPARRGNPRLTNAVLLLLGFALVCLTRQFLSETDHFTIGFSGVSGWSVTIFLAAVAIVLTQPTDGWTLRIILAIAILCRLVVLTEPPYLSSDIYRYVWDGVVQHAGVNPYHFVPGDTALTWLRDPNQDVFDNINRRDYARTIYPPVAQIIYFAATWLRPTVTVMKVTMFGFECITAACLVSLLRRLGRPVAQVLLYAWCPLLIWEIGDAGHIDAAVVAFIALALVFRARSRTGQRSRADDWLTGLFLGLAIMTKFYPLVLFPALWRRGDWRMPAAIAAVVAASYAAYASVGKLVFGFLGGYTQEEGLETGTRYFLLEWLHHRKGLAHLSTGVYFALCVLVMAAIVWWTWRYATTESIAQRPSDPQGVLPAPAVVRGCAMLAFALMLLFSPHYPWYIVWLVPLLALAPNLPMLVYICGFFYGFTTALADPGPKMFQLNQYLYGTVLAAFLIHFLLRRWPLHRTLHPLHGARAATVPQR